MTAKISDRQNCQAAEIAEGTSVSERILNLYTRKLSGDSMVPEPSEGSSSPNLPPALAMILPTSDTTLENDDATTATVDRSPLPAAVGAADAPPQQQQQPEQQPPQTPKEEPQTPKEQPQTASVHPPSPDHNLLAQELANLKCKVLSLEESLRSQMELNECYRRHLAHCSACGSFTEDESPAGPATGRASGEEGSGEASGEASDLGAQRKKKKTVAAKLRRWATHAYTNAAAAVWEGGGAPGEPREATTTERVPKS